MPHLADKQQIKRNKMKANAKNAIFQIFDFNKYFFCFPAMTDDPRFAEPIPNVTVALGRDANLPCVVENLGTYKVSQKNKEKLVKIKFNNF